MGSVNWCFTLNNYTNDDIKRLNELVSQDDRVKYLLYGKEVAQSGTPHLQGFIRFTKRTRLTKAKSTIGSNPHVEIARNVNASVQYCKKDGDWVEFGTFGQGQGQRSELEEIKTAIKGGMINLKDIRENFSDVYAKYPRWCMEYIRDNYPKVKIPDHPLRPWQRHLQSILEGEPDRRKIIFVVDLIGNTGKSWFSDWYHENNSNTQLLTPGKLSDMAYALQPGLRVLFMDAPRSKQGEFINYEFLENLKNGRVFSGKYESTMKTFDPIHVVVMMNEDPDRTKLSKDRYHVINIVGLN